MDTFEIAFWTCAVAGTTFFALKTLFMLLGGFDHDLDADLDSDDVAHEGGDSSDAAFQLISIYSLTGFFMMFGWVGLACYKQAEISGILSVLIAGFAGFFTMYVTAKLFYYAKSFASSASGSVFVIESTIGKVATVYQEIPENGKGVVQLVVYNTTREIEAVSKNGKIDSFKNVKIISVVNPTTVSVEIV